MWVTAFCEFPFTRVKLTSTGDVTMCAHMEKRLGNVLDSTFDEIWFNELAESIRLSTLSGDLHAHCKCRGCPFTEIKQPYGRHNIVYNEYPVVLELHLTPQRQELFRVLTNILHLVPNLAHIDVGGDDPFERGALFEVLATLNYSAHKERASLGVKTSGKFLFADVREEYFRQAPKSVTTFVTDPDGIENFHAFSKERGSRKLWLSSGINDSNLSDVVEIVRVAAGLRAHMAEFYPNGEVTFENCGRYAKAQRDIVAECERLRVPSRFLRPLDMGKMNDLVQLGL